MRSKRMFKFLSDIANGIVEQRIDYSGISEAPATLVAAVCSELGVGEVTGVRITQLILRANDAIRDRFAAAR
jgi:hypothetical protein